MSAKERDRLCVLSRVSSGSLSRGDGARLLRLSERQFRRVYGRWQSDGAGGLVHRLRGRTSNRRLNALVRVRALEKLRDSYRGFGPTLAAEKLGELDGIVVSRETVRQWQIAEGLWSPRGRRAKHRSWRARKSCFGELVQMDTSEHDWLEGRGEKCVLLAMIDDATSRVRLRFAPSDTTASNMSLLLEWIACHGRPAGLYVDRAGHFQVNRATTLEEDLGGLPAETQIGRALRELAITHVVARSPQAKGRVERAFGTCQDRLVKELRLKGVTTISEANAYLEQHYVPMWAERFGVAPASDGDAHRSATGYDLEAIMSHQEPRVVQNDYTIRYNNVRYQIGRTSAVAGLRGSRVMVEERLDGSVHLRWRGQYLANENRGDARLRPPAPSPAKMRRANVGHKPAPDHPWRAYRQPPPSAELDGSRLSTPGTAKKQPAGPARVKGLRSAPRTASPPLTQPKPAGNHQPRSGRRKNDPHRTLLPCANQDISTLP